jgi:HEAT repeat protein
MAAETLGCLKAQPDIAVPALILSLQTTNLELRGASLSALQAFMTNTATAIPPLTKCLGNPNPKVAIPAANALGKFGAQAESALPSLTNLLSVPQAFLPASNAIWRITRNVATDAPAQ